MNKKKTVTLATFVLVALSCLLFTTCKLLLVEDEDDLPLEEWVVTKVEYHPNFRLPYVRVFFSQEIGGYAYIRKGETDDNWMTSLVVIPGIELSKNDVSSNFIHILVDKQTAGSDTPLTASFSHEIFIKHHSDYWEQRDVARVRIVTDSMPVSIVE